MGNVKQKIVDMADMAEQILDSGVSDTELDEFMELQLSREDVRFYHTNKDIIFGMLGWDPDDDDYIDESIKMPRMNEDSFDEQEWLEDDDDEEDDEEDYNDDDLADYEWEVGSALSAQLEDNDIEFDSDNLGDALHDNMEFILQCMKNGMSALDCAVELRNDEEFMDSIVDYDDDDYDYDEMDESLIMPKLDEGCNCGKKRPITIPNEKRPLIKRPKPPVVKRNNPTRST